MDYLVISLAILVSGGFWLKFIYGHDKVEPEPISVVLRILIIGGFLSAFFAGLFNKGFSDFSAIPMSKDNLSFGKSFFLSLFVGLNEEFWKAFITFILVKNLKELDEPIDALVYSSSVALGFAVIENFEYVFQYGLVNLVMRSITAVPTHLGLSVIWGYSIAKVKFLKGKNYKDYLIPAIIQAGLLHAAYDFFIFYIENKILSLAISLFLAYYFFKGIGKHLRFLLNQSPFLKAGVCAGCGTLNEIKNSNCKNCNSYLVQEFYKICNACFTKNELHEIHCRECSDKLP